MARLSHTARAEHERRLAEDFAALLQRQAKRVAEQLRVRATLANALTAGPGAAGEPDDWWDQEQEADETRRVLRPAIAAAALASAQAVSTAYGPPFVPGEDFDAAVAAQTQLATTRTTTTTLGVFSGLVEGLNYAEAAAAVDRYADLPGRAATVGDMEVAGALILGGLKGLSFLVTRPGQELVGARTWILSTDHSHTDACDANAGRTIPAEEDWPGGGPGTLHFGCKCSEDYTLVVRGSLRADASPAAPAESPTLVTMTAPVATPDAPATLDIPAEATVPTESLADAVTAAASAPVLPPAEPHAPPTRVRIPRATMDKLRRYCEANNIALSLSEGLTAAADGSVEVEGGTPWHAVATVEGVAVAGAMGKREFAPGSLKTRALPLPLMLQREASHGSGQPGGAVICGAVTEATRDGAKIMNAGVFDTSEDGLEADRLVGSQMMRFVSVDAEVLEYELVMDEGADPLEALFGGGEILERYTDANEIGLTIVPFPAFAGCVITHASVDLPATAYDDLETQENPNGPLAIAAGAAWAQSSEHPPASWFENPNLAALTHARITPEGRVYGHVAPWDTGHVGYSRHRPAPRSPSAYSYFLTGRTDVVEEDGTVREVSTGRITLGTTHAASQASYAEAVAHYDHTGNALADVVCGEDAFGIWFSGALRPGVTAEQVRVFKASDVSGDWRHIRGAFDMIGILTVNAAGFPIPGSLTAAAAALVPDEGRVRVGLDEEGRELSLVAAGVIRQGPMTAMAELARRVVELEAIVGPLREVALERVAAKLTA